MPAAIIVMIVVVAVVAAIGLLSEKLPSVAEVEHKKKLDELQQVHDDCMRRLDNFDIS